MWKLMRGAAAGALMAAAVAACGQLQEPGPGYPEPPGLTAETRTYAGCLNDASSKRFEQSYSRQDSERYVFARCRPLEPSPAYRHTSGSPENDRCSEEHFHWHRSHNQTTDKVISRLFAETTRAGTGPPAGSWTQ